MCKKRRAVKTRVFSRKTTIKSRIGKAVPSLPRELEFSISKLIEPKTSLSPDISPQTHFPRQVLLSNASKKLQISSRRTQCAQKHGQVDNS